MSIVIDHLRFSYGRAGPVLRELNLAVRSGEVLGLLGPNGSGKTTTFRLLSGLLRPDSGDLLIDGVSVVSDPILAKRRTAYVPDEPLLYPTLSALENCDLFGRLWEVPRPVIEQRSEALLRQLELWPVRHQWVRAYSRGMRQRLSLVVALLHDPHVLILDEPFEGLDILSSLAARDLLRGFTQSGGTILFASHVPELIEALADKVAILDGGEIRYESTTAGVRRDGGLISVFARICRLSPPADGGNVFTEIEVGQCAAG